MSWAAAERRRRDRKTSRESIVPAHCAVSSLHLITDPARNEYEETGCPTLAAPLFLRLGWDRMSHFNLAESIGRKHRSVPHSFAHSLLKNGGTKHGRSDRRS